MVAAVYQGDFDPNHGIASDEALLEGLADPFFYSGDILFRNDATNDLVLKFKVFLAAHRQGVNFQPDIAELAVPSALPFMAPLRAGMFADGFAVGDTLIVFLHFDAEFALHALDGNVNVGFAHAGDERFGGFL